MLINDNKEPTEREKQSCLCSVCQNAHTKLEGINTFRRIEKLAAITSASEYLLYPKSLKISILHFTLSGFKQNSEPLRV